MNTKDIATTTTEDGETYSIAVDERGLFWVKLKDNHRRNGTQIYDGRFPRSAKSLSSAKGIVTKWLGYKTDWTYTLKS